MSLSPHSCLVLTPPFKTKKSRFPNLCDGRSDQWVGIPPDPCHPDLKNEGEDRFFFLSMTSFNPQIEDTRLQ